ncbi:MAG: hypothetical protein OXT74_07830 [Candidatus Poribacteria bacterium]|nr:hypothetical protein [Candidatus Poribacteria bacterium]
MGTALTSEAVIIYTYLPILRNNTISLYLQCMGSVTHVFPICDLVMAIERITQVSVDSTQIIEDFPTEVFGDVGG